MLVFMKSPIKCYGEDSCAGEGPKVSAEVWSETGFGINGKENWIG